MQLSDPIRRACVRDLRHVSQAVTLNELVRILQRNSFVLIEDRYFITFSDIFDVIMPQQKAYTQAEYDAVTKKANQSLYRTMFHGAALGIAAGAALAFALNKK